MKREIDGGDVAFVFFLGFIIGAMVLGLMGQAEKAHDLRTCRHTIQRNFGKSSAEAEALMSETKEWENK